MRMLILNDDSSFLDKANRFFFKRGFKIHLANNGVDGLVYLVKYQPEAIITNINLNELSGVDLYRLVKRKTNFNGKFYFISHEADDLRIVCGEEQHDVFSQQTAFNRILASANDYNLQI